MKHVGLKKKKFPSVNASKIARSITLHLRYHDIFISRDLISALPDPGDSRHNGRLDKDPLKYDSAVMVRERGV